MGKLTISMAIFHSYVSHYQRGISHKIPLNHHLITIKPLSFSYGFREFSIFTTPPPGTLLDQTRPGRPQLDADGAQRSGAAGGHSQGRVGGGSVESDGGMGTRNYLDLPGMDIHRGIHRIQ